MFNCSDTNGTCWSPHRVELALWTHYVASELQPELLDSIPNGTTATHSNGNEKSSNESESSNAASSVCIIYKGTVKIWILV